MQHKKYLLLSVFCLISGNANAAGFYIQEQSVSGLGTSFAGQVAIARDSSVLFYNPAGLTHLDAHQANVGVHFIYPHIDMVDQGSTIGAGGTPLATAGLAADDGGNPGSVSPVPNAYYAVPLSDDKSWWAGFGVSAPFGLGSHYSGDFFGRYMSEKSKLKTIDLQPTIAWQPVDWFSVGATAIVEHISANLKQDINAGAGDRDVSVKGKDWSLGWNFGVMIQPWETTTIGIDYRSKISHTLVGDQQGPGPNPLPGDSRADAKIVMPDIFSFGIAQELDDQWTLLASATWFGWNAFDRLTVVTDNTAVAGAGINFNYQTTWAYGLGVEYEMNDSWTLRAGYQYDQTPTTYETRSAINPDGDRNWYSAGATYTLNEKWSFDVAGTYIDISEEKINQTRAAVNVVAETDNAYVGIVAFAVNYKF